MLQIGKLERFALALFAATLMLVAATFAMASISLSDSDLIESQESMATALLFRDQDCRLSAPQIEMTKTDLLKVPQDVCDGRSKEIVYLASIKSLVGCLSQKIEWANRTMIGSKGLGKRKSGDRKTPVGTYWLGYPRKSRQFGIFIPVGYPNESDIARGYTGNAIGIHGPIRPFMCLPALSLKGDWTAGCLAFARDTQIIEVSDWVLANWPVKLTVTTD